MAETCDRNMSHENEWPKTHLHKRWLCKHDMSFGYGRFEDHFKSSFKVFPVIVWAILVQFAKDEDINIHNGKYNCYSKPLWHSVIKLRNIPCNLQDNRINLYNFCWMLLVNWFARRCWKIDLTKGTVLRHEPLNATWFKVSFIHLIFLRVSSSFQWWLLVLQLVFTMS